MAQHAAAFLGLLPPPPPQQLVLPAAARLGLPLLKRRQQHTPAVPLPHPPLPLGRRRSRPWEAKEARRAGVAGGAAGAQLHLLSGAPAPAPLQFPHLLGRLRKTE